jgi:hypothetical protein
MPQMGYDTKTDWLTECQSQYDFDFDFGIQTLEIELENWVILNQRLVGEEAIGHVKIERVIWRLYMCCSTVIF